MKKGYKTYKGFGVVHHGKDHNQQLKKELLQFILCCIVMGIFMFFFFNLTGGFQC